MEFEQNDILANYAVVDYKYFSIKQGIKAWDSHYYDFAHIITPLRVAINHTINISQSLQPRCYIKIKAIITVNKKTGQLLQDEKLFLLKCVINTSIIELEKRILSDSGLSLALRSLSDEEILRGVVDNIGGLN